MTGGTRNANASFSSVLMRARPPDGLAATGSFVSALLPGAEALISLSCHLHPYKLDLIRECFPDHLNVQMNNEQ